MYEEMTIERSILYIDQHHVDTFKILAKKLDHYSDFIKKSEFNQLDSWIIAFNIWLLLQPDDDLIIKTDEASLYYTANVLIYNAFKDDIHFQNLKERTSATPELFYLTSLNLGIGLYGWVVYMLKKYQLQDLIKRTNNRGYFDVLNGTSEEIQIFVENQAQFVKAAVKELRETATFTQMIKKCCDDAYFYYTDQYLPSLTQDCDRKAK